MEAIVWLRFIAVCADVKALINAYIVVLCILKVQLKKKQLYTVQNTSNVQFLHGIYKVHECIVFFKQI